MAHQRLRKFNLRDRYVDKVGHDIDFGLCMAVRAGNRTSLCGQSATSLERVYPCSTGLIVAGLAKPELKMEIDVEAIIPE